MSTRVRWKTGHEGWPLGAVDHRTVWERPSAARPRVREGLCAPEAAAGDARGARSRAGGESVKAANAYRTSRAPILVGGGRFLPFRNPVLVMAKTLHHILPEVRKLTLMEAAKVVHAPGRAVVVDNTRPRSFVGRIRLSSEVRR